MKKVLIGILLYFLFWGMIISIPLGSILKKKNTESKGSVTVLHSPEVFTDGTWNSWLVLEYQIQHAKTDIVIVNWKGIGGSIELGDRFIRFLNSVRKTVIIRVIGGSYSMHALVVCNSPNIEFNRGFLMFHLRADEDSNKVDRSSGSQRENQSYMQGCIYKGLLNQSDINRVNQDQVMYLYSNGQKMFTNDTRPL